MANYFLTFGVYSTAISGYEAAYDAFNKACDLSETMGDILVCLADAETGEVVADNDYSEDYESPNDC